MSETPTGPDLGYEPSDARIGSILAWGAGLAVVTVLTIAGMVGLFAVFESRSARLDPPPPALVEARRRVLPPSPRLQTVPRQDLEGIREEEERLLSTYGWVDPEAGVARVPIERAMKLVVERGLPAREEP